ncbi:MAG: mechanosensitive ion channel [Proteobacteria bacterium]|nr:mechanosensitive ion channel [Pseudomonadota bacterium]
MAKGLLQDLQGSLPLPEKIYLPGAAKPVTLKEVDQAAGDVVGQAPTLVLEVAVALLVVVGGWLFSRWMAGATQRMLVRARVEETVAAFLGSTARYALVLMSVVIAFNIVGVSLTGTVAVFGAIGLALAFALRNTLGHVAAGLMLIVNRPFRVGDFIELEGMMGTVKRITLFNTEINTLQNMRMFIPNTRIWDNILQNHTYNEVRAIEMRVAFSYDDDPMTCKEVLREVFAAEPLILSKPDPYLGTDALGESAIVYLFRVWVRTRDFGAVKGSLIDKIWHAAKERGLTMPYPQRVVHMAAAEPVRKGGKKA